MQGVFDELKKANPKELKHVTAEMKAKNREEKTSSTVPAGKKNKTSKLFKDGFFNPRGEAGYELENNRDWRVANYTTEEIVKIEATSIMQTLRVHNCQNVIIEVKGKINNVLMECCENVKLSLESVISAVDLVNLYGCLVQVEKTCYAANFNFCEETKICVTEDSKNIQLSTSMSSSLNLCIAIGDDWRDIPIPEHFVHRLTEDHTIKSEVSDLYG